MLRSGVILVTFIFIIWAVLGKGLGLWADALHSSMRLTFCNICSLTPDTLLKEERGRVPGT